MMRFALFTAFRYLASKKDNLFVSKLIVISVATVTLSIMLSIIVLSVVNGFHYSIEEKILSFDFHINIKDRYNNFESYKEVLEDISGNAYVELAIPFFQSQGFIKNNYEDKIYFVTIKAFNNEDIRRNKLFLKNFKLVRGREVFLDLPSSPDVIPDSIFAGEGSSVGDGVSGFELAGDRDIIIGEVLSNLLGVFKGDSLGLFLPKGDLQLDSDPSSVQSFKVSDLYSAGYARFDRGIVFIRYSAVSNIFAFSKLPSDIGILLKDEDYVNKFLLYLRSKYPGLLHSSVMTEGLFKDFAKEKKLMFIILFFLVLSSFATVYISISVVVLDKRKEIGVLKALGVRGFVVERIFILEGFLISFVGVFLGSFLGVLVTLSLTEMIRFIEFFVNRVRSLFFDYAGELFGLSYPYPFYIMDPSVFYLDSFPYRIYYGDIILLSVGAIFVSMFAAYLPSRKVSRDRVASAFVSR